MVKIVQGCVAVFRTTDDQVFDTSDSCPHKGAPLSEGIVHGTSVTRPLHNWVLSLERGLAQCVDTGEIATYPARIQAGCTLMQISRLARRVAA